MKCRINAVTIAVTVAEMALVIMTFPYLCQRVSAE